MFKDTRGHQYGISLSDKITMQVRILPNYGFSAFNQDIYIIGGYRCLNSMSLYHLSIGFSNSPECVNSRRKPTQDESSSYCLHYLKKLNHHEVMGPSETSFEKLIAEVDHELISHHLIELKSIEMALNRIENGSYGVCIDCNSKIAYNRLKACPMAKRCIECKQYFEKQSA